MILLHIAECAGGVERMVVVGLHYKVVYNRHG